MLDTILLAEWIWCTLAIAGRGIERTLLLAGGSMTAGYAAATLSPWLTKTFVPPNSPVFQWTVRVIDFKNEPVTLSSYFPPIPTAWIGKTHLQWITSHILLSMMFVVVTATIFIVFLMIAMVREALWDIPQPPTTVAQKVLQWCVGTMAAAYVTGVSTVLLVNLTWIEPLHWLSGETATSVLVHWIGLFVAHVI